MSKKDRYASVLNDIEHRLQKLEAKAKPPETVMGVDFGYGDCPDGIAVAHPADLQRQIDILNNKVVEALEAKLNGNSHSVFEAWGEKLVIEDNTHLYKIGLVNGQIEVKHSCSVPRCIDYKHICIEGLSDNVISLLETLGYANPPETSDKSTEPKEATVPLDKVKQLRDKFSEMIETPIVKTPEGFQEGLMVGFQEGLMVARNFIDIIFAEELNAEKAEEDK